MFKFFKEKRKEKSINLFNDLVELNYFEFVSNIEEYKKEYILLNVERPKLADLIRITDQDISIEYGYVPEYEETLYSRQAIINHATDLVPPQHLITPAIQKEESVSVDFKSIIIESPTMFFDIRYVNRFFDVFLKEVFIKMSYSFEVANHQEYYDKDTSSRSRSVQINDSVYNYLNEFDRGQSGLIIFGLAKVVNMILEENNSSYRVYLAGHVKNIHWFFFTEEQFEYLLKNATYKSKLFKPQSVDNWIKKDKSVLYYK